MIGRQRRLDHRPAGAAGATDDGDLAGRPVGAGDGGRVRRTSGAVRAQSAPHTSHDALGDGEEHASLSDPRTDGVAVGGQASVVAEQSVLDAGARQVQSGGHRVDDPHDDVPLFGTVAFGCVVALVATGRVDPP